MLYFILHQIKYILNPNNIKLKFEKYNDDSNSPYISKSLSIYLNKTKGDISNYLSNWDIIRYTNPMNLYILIYN